MQAQQVLEQQQQAIELGASAGSSQLAPQLGYAKVGASGSVGRTTGGTTGSNLNQMLLNKNQLAGGALDVSASLSAVDELVQLRLNQIAEEFEEKQIAYERQKQDELKDLERDKKVEMARIAEDAEDEIEYMRDRIKHEIKASQESGLMSEANRKEELAAASKKAILRSKEKENAKFERMQEELKADQQENIEQLKDDHKERHEREMGSVKNKYQAKLDLEKQRMSQSNN